MQLLDRHRALLRAVRAFGPVSRKDLHERLNLRPNTVGELVEELVQEGLLCEGQPEPSGRGRPLVPLMIDRDRRTAVGIAVQSDRIQMTRMDLLGQRLGQSRSVRRSQRSRLSTDLTKAVAEASEAPGVAAIGISIPGLIDKAHDRVVLSAANARAANIDWPALEKLARTPLVLDNDMHAVAAQWLLQDRIAAEEDTLLIYLNDGAVGSVLLVDGRPNHGCILGGNELGHTRYDEDTDICFCGHAGCLECIFSTAFLHRHSDNRSLFDAAAASPPHRDEPGEQDSVLSGTALRQAPPIDRVRHHLAMGLANSINFIRPHRVHLISPLATCTPFRNALEKQLKSLVLAGLIDHVTIDWSSPPSDEFAQAAGWLALTPMYFDQWSRGYVSAF